MPKFIIRLRGNSGKSEVEIESDCKRNAMKKFNQRFKTANFEILEIAEVQMDNEIIKKESITLQEYNEIQRKQQERAQRTIQMLEETNEILFEQLKKFKDLDLSDKEKASIEIAKNNSLAGTAKTLVQSVSIKTLLEKQKGTL